jgi:hypothetical protein
LAEPKKKRPRRNPSKAGAKPPGEFISEDLQKETERFLDEVKRQISRRTNPDDKPKLRPPSRRKR